MESLEPPDHAFRVGPQGHPVVQPHFQGTPWGKAFARSVPEGLWALASEERLPDATAQFWRSISVLFLTRLADRQTLEEPNERRAVPLPEEALLALVSEKPLCPGAEYVTPQAMRDLWFEMNGALAAVLDETRWSPAQWLQNLSGDWGLLGSVCLHLAENKRSETHPFAFLATLAVSMTDQGRVLFMPLGRALEEAEALGKPDRIVAMLRPLVDASASLPWLLAALQSKEIFSARVWTAAQAHVFLQSLSTLSTCGIRVRVPDWWAHRTSQVKAKVIVDAVPGVKLGAEGLLRFDVSLALGDETLTAAEMKEILSAHHSFVRLRGRWVEVNKEKIEQALALWNRASGEVERHGLSWHEGMRLVSGAGALAALPAHLAGVSDLSGTGARAWTDVVAGAGIEGLLSRMRTPDASKEFEPGSALKAQLRPYQLKGVAWLGLLTDLGLGACLADDMGLGKTMQVISLLLCRKRRAAKVGARHRTLLVVPASLLANWSDECARFAPSLHVHIDHAAFKNTRTFEEADIIVTTYSSLTRSERHREEKWDLLVLDEAQAIKTPHATQTKIVKSLKAKARVALTGTPIENRLMDLWSLFDFLNPGLLSTQERFRGFASPKGTEPRLGPLRALTQPYILRRLKTDKSIISDLPDKCETLAWCNLSKQQIALYADTVKEFAETLKISQGLQRRGIVLSYLMRFKQICNHPDQALGMGDFDPCASGKYLRLEEIAQEVASRQEKLLVFTQYREMCPVLARWLGRIFGREGLVLDGSTAVVQRRRLVADFQSDNGPPFFVLSLKAGGTGLTLTAANHVVHFDRWWNPAVENQATDRAFRIGQHRNVMVHKLVCRGTLEERIDEMIFAKKGLAEGVLGTGAEVPLTELSDTALLKLVSLDLSSLVEDAESSLIPLEA